jgi:hypothetical protein
MRFMVIVKGGNKGCEGEKTPRQEFLAAMGKYNEELKKAGVFLELEGLTPATMGTRVKFSGKKPVVTDGPFAESKELVGGFWLWKCQSKQEAIEWLKRAPFEEADVEIREVHEPENFADLLTRAYQEQEARQRETVETRR